MVDVAITQNDDIGAAIDAALGHLDLHDLLRDRLVALKPNDTYATPDDRSGVTQPDTLGQDAIKAFTERAYGQELTFQHA